MHIRDNLDLPPNAYRITIMGVSVGGADIYLDKHLAINPGQVFGQLDGIAAKDPAFDLDAVWIEADKREHAQTLGYTVVDPSTMVATPLSQVIQEHSYELLGHEEVQKMLDKLSESAPKLVQELVPDLMPLGSLVKVMQTLLAEQILVKDIRTIAETLAEAAHKNKDTDYLVSAVRIALARMIIQKINEIDSEVPVIILNPELEQLLQNALQMNAEGGGGFEPSLAERMQKSLVEVVERQEMAGQPSILLVQSGLRQLLSRFARQALKNLHVLAYQEIPHNKQIRIVGTVG